MTDRTPFRIGIVGAENSHAAAVAREINIAKHQDWHLHPMRIVALQTAYDGPGLHALDVWDKYGFNVEQLLHLIGNGYFAVFCPEHEARVREYVAEAHKRGIRIILYLNTHLLDPAETERREEWSARDLQGAPRMAYDTYRIGCTNTDWGERLIESARRACRCGVDGIFSDGPLLGCYCARCRALFAAAGGGDDLNGPLYPGFLRQSMVKFIRGMHAAIKRENPSVVFYQNLDVHGRALSELLPYNDLVGSEGGFMFYGPPKHAFLWKPSRTAKALEAAAGGKPTVIFAAADQKGWSLYPHTPAETKLMFAGSAANGASVWYGLHFPLSMLKGPTAQAAREINLFLRDHAHWYDDTVSRARVALFYSALSADIYKSAAQASDFYGGAQGKAIEGPGNVAASYDGFAAMLYRSQIPFDVLLEHASPADMARYDCIVMPTAPCLADETVDRLRAYVAAGGNLVACLDVGFFDEAGQPRAACPLADVLGARFEAGLQTFRTFDYMAVEDRASGLFEGLPYDLVPAALQALKVVPAGARVAARFHAPMPGRYVELTERTHPAMLIHTFGKGRMLYFPGSVGEFYHEYSVGQYATILANAMRAFAAQPVSVSGAPESLEVTHRAKRDGSADLVHLVNYTGGMSRPIAGVVPLHGLRIACRGLKPIQAATSLATGRKLKAAVSKTGAQAFALPVLHEYDVVVLEH